MLRGNRHYVVFLLTMVTCASCAQPTAIPASSELHPQFQRSRIAPLEDFSELFEDDAVTYSYKSSHDRASPQHSAHASDVAAVDAALAWIEQHVGKLPDRYELVVEKILHSASGHETPQFDWDNGHTITFRGKHGELLTDDFAIIYLNSDSVLDAVINLAAYSELEQKDRVCSKEEAIEAVVSSSPDNVDEAVRTKLQSALYQCIVRDPADPQKARVCWRITGNDTLYVDGATKAVMHDD